MKQKNLVGSIVARLCLVLTVFAIHACTVIHGDGIPDTQESSVAKFREIQIDVPGRVEVNHGSEHHVEIIADQNLLEYFKISTSSDRLRIYHPAGVALRPDTPIRIVIEVEELHTVENNASADIRVDQLVHNDIAATINGSGDVLLDTADALDAAFKINGSGNMQVNGLSVDALEVKINGSGDWQGNGETEELFLTINASGDYLGFDVVAQQAEVAINGSGDAEVYASRGLDATINGSGSVRYQGRPQVDMEINGSGTVKEN